MRRLLMIFLCVMMISSCASVRDLVYDTTYESAELDLNLEWAGKSYADIVRAKGAPTRTADDGKGGKIHVYESFSTTFRTTTSTDTIFDSVSTETTQKQNRTFTEFYVDEDNRCYLVRSNEKVPSGERLNPTHLTILGSWLATVVLLLGTVIF